MINKNSIILSRGKLNNFNDVVFTPKEIVQDIVEWVNPYGKILEPFKGDGAFYDELVRHSRNTLNEVDWTEITEGKDFFDVTKHYDFIVTNPPYSIFTELLEKCFEISDNVILLIPHNKLFTSDKRLDMIAKYGDIVGCKRFKVPKEWSAKFPIGAWWIRKRDSRYV